ncbi:unnamed protein product [Blepharisma stoltei]|uniref:ATP synthase F0 subunit 8 n=1 Tax=Blepharisma stoltei TaxID=1481888 RepID=A0AAU9J6X0_9CILI|nr:unnamed protein product [Blepharisma stoltei]
MIELWVIILVLLGITSAIFLSIWVYLKFFKPKPLPELTAQLLYGSEMGDIELTSFSANPNAEPRYSTLNFSRK